MTHFNRVDKIIDEIKEMDVYLKPDMNVESARNIINDGNHFLLRHIAINTAIIADYIDRLYIKEGVDDV